MKPFDLTDSSTWPVTLDVDQMALIYRRTVGGIRKACQQKRFFPQPFQTHPYLWRRDDVTGYLERPKVASHLRKVG